MSKQSMATVAGRLRAVRGSMSRAKFAKRVGTSPHTFGRYERGDRDPPLEYVQKVGATFGIDASWILDGTGSVPDHIADWTPGDGAADEGDETTDDVVEAGEAVRIRLLKPRVGAGDGDAAEDLHAGHFLLDAGVARRLAAPTEHLRAAIVRGDSMEPALFEGDVVVFARDPEARDAVCVVAVNGAVLVKRVQTIGDDKIRIVSENPLYAPREVGPEDDVRVIGRVVWRGQMGAR